MGTMCSQAQLLGSARGLSLQARVAVDGTSLGLLGALSAVSPPPVVLVQQALSREGVS